LVGPAEETELARRIHGGDVQARDRLICGNLRFVVSVAKRYQHLGVPLADLINEGNIGLLRAARRFDETKGVKFISYAVWWIRQAILQALAHQARPVRIPVGHAGQLRTGVAIGGHVVVIRGSLSLDAPMGTRSDMLLGEVLADETTVAPDDSMQEGDLEEATAAALATLRPRELNVLRRYFGLDHKDPLTLEEIAEGLGVTRERVRQIKDHALRKIRESRHASALASFHGG
jgi:RNA polymerase primary sigma factor